MARCRGSLPQESTEPGAVESGTEFSRRRYTPGRVVPVDAFHVVVSRRGPRDSKYVERYGLRDGVPLGGGTGAELVNSDPESTAARDPLPQQTRQADVAYHERSRRRADVEALRALCAAVDELLIDSPGG